MGKTPTTIDISAHGAATLLKPEVDEGAACSTRTVDAEFEDDP
jgi:hypothetical protein